MNKNYHLEKYKEFSALLLLVVWTWKITFDPGQFQFPKKTNPMTDNFSRKRGCWKILWGLGTTFSKMIYWTSALRCIEENKASSTFPSKTSIFFSFARAKENGVKDALPLLNDPFEHSFHHLSLPFAKLSASEHQSQEYHVTFWSCFSQWVYLFYRPGVRPLAYFRALC